MDAIHLLLSANEVWGKVIFSEACVKNSVHGGGGYLGRYSPWDQVPPRPGTPPGRYTPSDQVHPPGSYTPQDQVHPQDQVPPGQVHNLDQVHPQRPGTPPQTRYTPKHSGRYGKQAGSTHPTGMHSCLIDKMASICSTTVKFVTTCEVRQVV